MKPRFYVTAWHGELGSIFQVLDRKTGRAKIETSTMRQGAAAKLVADMSALKLNAMEMRKHMDEKLSELPRNFAALRETYAAIKKARES